MSIIIPRASTYFKRIRLEDEHKNCVLLTDTDKLIFEVKKNPKDNDSRAYIKKIMTHDDEFEGGYGFELTPEETDLPEGTYCYGIGVQRKNGEYYHVISIDEFIIKQSVSRKDD